MRTFDALGTTALVHTVDPDRLDGADAVVREEVAAIDRACSRFRCDSDLSRVNAAAGSAVPVGSLLLDALDGALRAARLTDGLVSPTVGTVMGLLGYDRDFATIERDGRPNVRVGPVPAWQLVSFDRLRQTVRVPVGTLLDLGATAKAFCADRAARRAAAVTGTGVLVSLGGDIAVAGAAPSDGWTVRIADDHRAPRHGDSTIAVMAGGVATSGTAVRQWVRGGEVFHHVVDPRTGRPAATCWRTVSVAAGSCLDANIASTATLILGESAPQWLADQSLPARLVAVGGTVVSVGGWPADEVVPC